MAHCIRIARWAEHFEKNRTRELRAMTWVPVPNRFDGDGYTELVDHPDGPAHFGAWIILIEVASKCDPRGTLIRQGPGGALVPHDAKSISRMTRFPVPVLESAIARLSEIGWLEVVELADGLLDASHVDAVPPHGDAALSRARGRGRTGEERGEEGQESRGARAHTHGDDLPELPEGLRTEAFQTALADWMRYKQERRENYKPTGLKHLLSSLERRGAEEATEALQVAMAQGWQGPAAPDAIARIRRQSAQRPDPRRMVGADAERHDGYRKRATVVELPS